jgi:SAM-dependent methyltransferase
MLHSDYVHGGTQKDAYGPEDVETVRCPLCDGDQPSRLYREQGELGICSCRSCGLIYTSPRARAPEKVYWGEEEMYLAESRLIFDGVASHHRDPNYRQELREIERFKRGGRILDVGCNMGMLLRLAQKKGWKVTGVEPSPSLSRLARRWGFEVHNCFLNELPDELQGSFDVVAFSDVFEHITNPVEFLESAQRLLAEDGILYVKVPNARWNLLKQRLLGLAGRQPGNSIWDAYEHVVHYTDRTLPLMLGRGKFKVLRMTGARPVQSPNWHEWTGHYYQYPTPWFMDGKRKAVRRVFHWLSFPERLLRLGGLGPCSQTLVAIARKA